MPDTESVRYQEHFFIICFMACLCRSIINQLPQAMALIVTRTLRPDIPAIGHAFGVGKESKLLEDSDDSWFAD
jgi:hypothetical protein